MRAALPYELEFRLRGRDGAYRWFLARAMPMRDGTGRVVRWFGTCTDIDEQKLGSSRDAFLAGADALFGTELDADAIMAAVARAAVASFADYCVFDLIDETDAGVLRRAAFDHRDPHRREPFGRVDRRRVAARPPGPSGAHGLAHRARRARSREPTTTGGGGPRSTTRTTRAWASTASPR